MPIICAFPTPRNALMTAINATVFANAPTVWSSANFMAVLRILSFLFAASSSTTSPQEFSGISDVFSMTICGEPPESDLLTVAVTGGSILVLPSVILLVVDGWETAAVYAGKVSSRKACQRKFGGVFRRAKIMKWKMGVGSRESGRW